MGVKSKSKSTNSTDRRFLSPKNIKKHKQPLHNLVVAFAVIIFLVGLIFLAPKISFFSAVVIDEIVSSQTIRRITKDPVLYPNNPNLKLESSFTSSGNFDKTGTSTITNYFKKITETENNKLADEMLEMVKNNHWQDIRTSQSESNSISIRAKKIQHDKELSLWININNNGLIIEIGFNK